MLAGTSFYNNLKNESNVKTKRTANGKINGKINEDIILNIISKENAITISDLAKKAGISARTVSRLLTALKERGKIIREGANKSGHWRVLR